VRVPICTACGTENPEQARFCFSCGTALDARSAAPREARKVVTIVFSDVAGSTRIGERLDPEALRTVMSRYFDVARAALERHGGTVEKFIGDAVMAVFGVPKLHEDDALRAVRAADEMRDAVARLNDELEPEYGVRLETRIGVNTGEVVVGEGEGAQRLATGDAVNVAARLEQAAGQGEILLGPDTYRLVRDAVRVEALAPLPVKGKDEPIAAHRLLEVAADAPAFARRLETPLVGRERERRLLREAFERAVAERACHLFTLLGTAGVGKSRLAAELLADIGAAASVVGGRCLPYGEGITFWPLVEIVASLDAEAALDGVEDAELIARRIAGVTGGGEAADTPEETFWAVRRLLEALAREQPVVVVLDDLHWAEPTFLDLVEHIADWSRDAPLLLLCLARPELLELRQGWAGGKLNATTILLEPLSDRDTDVLIERLLGDTSLDDETRAEIRRAAEGNPLFVEQMLALRAEGGDVRVPPTIQALLAARLDRLPDVERGAIGRAAVEGKVFHHGAVAELSPPDAKPTVGPSLLALLRKQLIHPDQTQLPGEQAYRFGHLLIRDAAYEALPKQARAELHERFADWLEHVVPQRVAEFEEIVAWHLEQAYRYRSQLGPANAGAEALGTRAAERLASAGLRAYARTDMGAAAGLLQRALAVPGDERAQRLLLLPLTIALLEQGDHTGANAVVADLRRRADAEADDMLEAQALLAEASAAVQTGGTMARSLELGRQAAVHADRAGDDAALAHAWNLNGRLLFWLGHITDGAEALERAVLHAERGGSVRDRSEALGWLASTAVYGPTPLGQAIDRISDIERRAQGHRYIESSLLAMSGLVRAYGGAFDEARSRVARAAAIATELGLRVHAASLAFPAGDTELCAGDAAAAERVLRAGYEELTALGEKGYLSGIAAALGRVRLAQGDLDDADRFALEGRELAAADDVWSQVLWRLVRAQTLALRGDVDAGLAVAREAVAIAEATEYVTEHALALEALGDVLVLARRTDDAAAAFERAHAIAAEKENVVVAERLRARLAELERA
jgi:class 3 adenylate cyclase